MTPVIPESIDAKTSELIQAFSGNADGLALPIRDWYQLFPHSFYRIASRELRPERDALIFQLMLSDADCCRHLCNATLLDTQAAVQLTHNLFAVGQQLDIRLAQAAIEWAKGNKDRNALRRCLQLLDSLEPGNRIDTYLVRLLTSPDGFVRSKAFELLIRSSLNEQDGRRRLQNATLPPQFHRTWAVSEDNVRGWLRDPDPRVRANLIEFLSKMYSSAEWLRQVLLDHLSDPHGRVAANSAVGLSRMGNEAEAIARLTEMASHEDANIRSSAAWGMGQAPNPQFAEILNRLRTDTAPHVRWNALKSLKRAHKIASEQKETALLAEENVPQASETLLEATGGAPADPGVRPTVEQGVRPTV